MSGAEHERLGDEWDAMWEQLRAEQGERLAERIADRIIEQMPETAFMEVLGGLTLEADPESIPEEERCE